jgi:ferredoxin
MKIVVDFDLCESNAVCMQIAPDVFEVRDSDRERMEECVQRCPKQAISIED